MLAASWMACAEPRIPSADVATLDLYAHGRASDRSDGLALELAFDGPDGILRFGGTDRLSLRGADGEIPLDWLGTEYEARLGSYDGELTVALSRRGDSDASFTFALPPAIALAAAATDDGLQISWEPARGDPDLVLGVDGDCIEPISRQLGADTGAYTISRAELFATGDCLLDITLEASTRVDGSQVESRWGERWWIESTRTNATTFDWSGP